jgi:hypothetical protein
MTGHVIVCAHPDDELLGAFEILAGARVVYARVPSTDDMRAAGRFVEAETLCLRTGAAFAGMLGEFVLAADCPRVWVPDATDLHVEHRMAQAQGIELATRHALSLGFYSVEKRAPSCRPRAADVRDRVRALFLEHYPSQHTEYLDPAGWLFSGSTLSFARRHVFTMRDSQGATWEIETAHPLLMQAAARVFQRRQYACPTPTELALELRAEAGRASPNYQIAPVTVRQRSGTYTEEVTL